MSCTKRSRIRSIGTTGLLLVWPALAFQACGPREASPGAAEAPGDLSTGTHVVLLGTGTPNPEPEASGPATAVLVDGRAYIVDAGVGLVRRAAEAADRYGAESLTAARLDIAFLTHLHSDHTVGLPDLIHTPWVAERDGGNVHAPDGGVGA